MLSVGQINRLTEKKMARKKRDQGDLSSRDDVEISVRSHVSKYQPTTFKMFGRFSVQRTTRKGSIQSIPHSVWR